MLISFIIIKLFNHLSSRTLCFRRTALNCVPYSMHGPTQCTVDFAGKLPILSTFRKIKYYFIILLNFKMF